MPARTFSDDLRGFIRDDGRTAYALGRDADVDPAVISRFMGEARGLSSPVVDRLTAALGIRLAAPPRPKGRPKATAKVAPKPPPAAAETE